MFPMLTSMPSCLINSSAISVCPSSMAQINAVSLNVKVKFHKSFKFSFHEKSKI